MRRKTAFFGCILGLTFVLNGCTTVVGKPTSDPEPWPFEEDAITVNIKAHHDLNWFEGMAHPVIICVYQLKEESPFVKKTKEPVCMDRACGLDELLRCNTFDEEVTDTYMTSIQPGDKITSITMDRAKKTQFVAIVGGYQQREGDRIVRIYPIRRSETIQKMGWFNRMIVFEPEKMDIDLVLGKDQIESPIPKRNP